MASAASRARKQQALAMMRQTIEEFTGGSPPGSPPLDAASAGLLMDLWAGQAAREGAFVLLAFALVEGRPLDLIDQSKGDLGEDAPRIAGDRATSEALSNLILRPLGIPATKGALASSTYRGGYLAKQAKNPALARFVGWASHADRQLGELEALFRNLAAGFAAEAFVVGDLPELDRLRFVFSNFSELIVRLLATPSQGAFQQYLFAALLDEYVEATIRDRRLRVATKPLFQSDRTASTLGDVEVRAGQNLEAVYEVSASNWKTKLAQAVESLTTHDELSSITILASQPPASGSEILAALAGSPLPSGVEAERLDIAVLGVETECISLAAKLSPRERTNVVTKLYDYLVRFCRTQPALVEALLRELEGLGLADRTSDPMAGTTEV